MRGYPQFSFWIPIGLAKICLSHSHKPHKNTSVLVGTVLKRIFVLRPKMDFFPRGKSKLFWSEMTKFQSEHFSLVYVPRDLGMS